MNSVAPLNTRTVDTLFSTRPKTTNRVKALEAMTSGAALGERAFA